MDNRLNAGLGCTAGCAVALIILIVVALALVNVAVAGAQAPLERPDLTCADSDAWFWSDDTWLVWLVTLESKACLWGTPDDANSLQRPGHCNWDSQHNRLVVLTHNWYCDANNCPKGVGGVSDIPLLEEGEGVQLCEFGRLWTGSVTWSELVTDGDPQPQTDFECGSETCGTIVTSYGHRLWPNGPAEGYWLVRIQYR